MSIYVVGAQCTGKTTLVEALQEYFTAKRSSISSEKVEKAMTPPPLVFTEVARTVLRQHNFTADDIVSSPAKALRFQKLILEAQERTESAAGERWFISDRSGVDPVVYARRYVGEAAAQDLMKSDAWIGLKGRLKQSLIIVCEAGVDWLIDDGVRLMPQDQEDWMKFHDMFCTTLDTLGLKYITIPRGLSDLGKRVDFVLQHWRSN